MVHLPALESVVTIFWRECFLVGWPGTVHLKLPAALDQKEANMLATVVYSFLFL